MTKETNEVMNRLDQISKFKFNWDDNGSDSINPTSIEQAKIFISDRLSEGISPYFVVANTDGGVVLEYRNGHISMEIEINENELRRLIVFNDSKLLYDGPFKYQEFFNRLPVDINNS